MAEVSSTTSTPAPLEAVQIEVAGKKLSRAATVKDMQRKSVVAVKTNPKKAAGCGTCCIIAIVLAIVLPVTLAGAAVAYYRYYRYTGNSRTAAVGGAALGQGGRESLIPAQTADVAAARRRLQATAGALSTCPRDSQAVIESEATPETVFDGTTIFTTVDQINCLMRLAKPGNDVTLNQGAYTAIINENTCQPASQSQGGGGGGGMGGGGGGGGQGGGGGGAPEISLKTVGVNSTRPTLENPEQPFQVKLILPFTIPTDPYNSFGVGGEGTGGAAAPAGDHLIWCARTRPPCPLHRLIDALTPCPLPVTHTHVHMRDPLLCTPAPLPPQHPVAAVADVLPPLPVTLLLQLSFHRMGV